MTADLAEAMRTVGLSPIRVWGMTETSGVGTVVTPDSSAPVGSLGVPLPYMDLYVMVSDERETDVDEMGEVWARDPGAVSGEGRSRTGDLATRDAGDWLHMMGRTRRTINTAEELVAPSTVGCVLRTLDEVSDVLVVGLSDERWRQIVAVLIVPSTQGQARTSSMSTEMLSAALSDALVPWEKVRRTLVVSVLPTTITGRPDPVAAVRPFDA